MDPMGSGIVHVCLLVGYSWIDDNRWFPVRRQMILSNPRADEELDHSPIFHWLIYVNMVPLS